MNKNTFQRALNNLIKGIPFKDSNKLSNIYSEFEQAGFPKHIPLICRQYLEDWIICSCRWKSNRSN